jgi:hypothetical protein
VAAASLNQYGNILASRTETVTLLADELYPAHLPELASQFRVMLRVPRHTRRVRVILEAEDGGGSVPAELDRKTINAAPATETPTPQLNTDRLPKRAAHRLEARATPPESSVNGSGNLNCGRLHVSTLRAGVMSEIRMFQQLRFGGCL